MKKTTFTLNEMIKGGHFRKDGQAVREAKEVGIGMNEHISDFFYCDECDAYTFNNTECGCGNK